MLTNLCASHQVRVALIALIAIVPFEAFAANVNKQPLARFAKIYGQYTQRLRYGGREFEGTLTIAPTSEDSRVEWIARTSFDGVIREVRWVIGVDQETQQLWVTRSTVHEGRSNERGRVHFDGRDILMEWPATEGDGTSSIFRMRWSQPSDKTLKMVTEQGHDGRTRGNVVMLAERVASNSAIPHAS